MVHQIPKLEVFVINRSTSNSLHLRAAITGFLKFKMAKALSQRSVDSYKRILEQWAEYAGNKKVAQFTDRDINAYLVYLLYDLTCVRARFRFRKPHDAVEQDNQGGEDEASWFLTIRAALSVRLVVSQKQSV